MSALPPKADMWQYKEKCPLWANSGRQPFDHRSQIEACYPPYVAAEGNGIHDTFKDGETYWFRAGAICA